MPVGSVVQAGETWVLIQSDGGVFYRASRKDCWFRCEVGDPVAFDVATDPGTNHAIASNVGLVPR
jgi:hypothetical protein